MASIVARPYARAVAMGRGACLVAAILGARYAYDLESLPGDTAFLGQRKQGRCLRIRKSAWLATIFRPDT